MNLSANTKVTLVQAALADGQTDPNSTAVDMAGFDGVMFIGIVGTVTGSGTVNLAAQQSDDDTGSPEAFAAISGASASITAGEDDKFLIIDVYRPLERYIRVALTRAVGNSVYGGTLAIQYNARVKPTTHDSSTLAAAAVLVMGAAEA